MTNIPESHREKLCESKKKYSNEKNALDHLKVIRKRGLIVPPNARAYKCFFCGFWHLGHKRDDDPK
jgi:hypothetical protein